MVSDLFLSVGYLSFGEKTGKNGKRKKRREKETERKQAPKTYSNCSHCESRKMCRTCSGPEKQAPKTYSNCSHCGPERRAAVRKSKHPKRTLIAFPDRCTSFRTAISTIRVLFGCLLFRTAAGLSGPQWLQLE